VSRTTRHPWPSAGLAISSMAELVNAQAGELRCTRTAARNGLPVDETCATAVDRIQDEIDRRADSPQYRALGYVDYPGATLGENVTQSWTWVQPTPKSVHQPTT
jgi:hypothetical protein